MNPEATAEDAVDAKSQEGVKENVDNHQESEAITENIPKHGA